MECDSEQPNAEAASLPELPEVETVRRSLAPRVVGRRFTAVAVHERRLRTPLVPAALRRALLGRRVDAVARRSKYLLFDLDGDRLLVVHLGMTGRLLRQAKTAPRLPHTHVRLALDDDSELRFVDPRRFGMLFVVARDALAAHPRFASLGPEPLSPAFTAAGLQTRAGGAARAIKTALMDAAVVVGVGNIYACEALFRAGIHPTTPTRRLRAARWLRLHAAVQQVLADALAARGTTLNDFRDSDGRGGGFQAQLHVYGREGSACRRCARRVRRIVQAGRSTFYCPGCQH
jgi:formamidopyrimidine-DNA glycosylase